VIQGFPGVDEIDVVEINPAYLELVRTYPDVAPLLTDPRVRVHVDDGRRWLKRNPDARYDLIVQNTTFYWRVNSTNLLSQEYFTEVESHLMPGGVVTFNTTGSFDVLRTAAAVFGHAYRYGNFVYCSDVPLVPRPERLTTVMRPNGAPFSFASAPQGSVAARLSQAQLEPAERFIAARGADGIAAVITDDNLLVEYRHGVRFPEGVRWLLPPEPPVFDLDDPVIVPDVRELDVSVR
jgi:spermidine synthase